jgi:Sulfotransferase family
MALPDFFIAGAPKAGTTALHVALAKHPSLYMSAVKEPKFFLTDGPPPTRGGPGDVQTYREHVWRRDDYEALFNPAPAGTLRGESTPFYLYNSGAQRRIRALVPDARLIVILRDPVERAHSNWTHLWSAGLDPVGDFVLACAEEQRRIEAGWADFWHYTALGRYGEQLQQLYMSSCSATVPWSRTRPRCSTGSAPSSACRKESSPRFRERTSPPIPSGRSGMAPCPGRCGSAPR